MVKRKSKRPEKFQAAFVSRFQKNLCLCEPNAIEGILTPAGNDKAECDPDPQQKVLVTFAGLIAEPIHKKPVLDVRGHNNAQSQTDEKQGDKPGCDSCDQGKGAEKFDHDDKKSEHPRQANRTGKKAHGSGKPVSAEPTQ